MTRKSVREYVEAIRGRYLVAKRKQKSVILDEFCQTTGYSRKAAIRVLGHPPAAKGKKRGRKREYGLAVREALREVWEASDWLCSKYLESWLTDFIPILERQGELKLEEGVKEQLLRMSPATMDRLLKPYRKLKLRQPHSQSRAHVGIKALVPVRTFGEWANVKPGSVQADLVMHCGDTTEGFYLTSLVVVDVATGWTESQAVWGKGRMRVCGAMQGVRRGLPVALEELHTDNGGEFLNEVLYPYLRAEGISSTRGRSYHKNDQAYVEQKNWSVVRQLVGYDRYSTKAAYEKLRQLYELVRLQVNFFKPMSKVVAKERVGAKVKKRYDKARTPYQRLLESGVLDEEQQKALEELYLSLNPVKLKAEIDEALEKLWALADKPGATKGKKEACG